MKELHVVLGAGQVGTKLARGLLARGHRVRVVRRGAAGPSGSTTPNLEHRSGDIEDLAFAARASEGASVVYHCVNPNYDEWAARIPPMTRGVIETARAAKAKLVVLDNLYMYDVSQGRPMREDATPSPVSKKGQLRVEATNAFLDADRRGDCPTMIVRASDFYGPDTPRASIFGERFFQAIASGGAIDVLGDPTQPHSYSYTPDVALAMIELGARADAYGQIWHAPVAPAESTTQMIERFSRALGRTVKARRVPDFVLRAMGLFQPVLREVAEMTYQWKTPFILDDSKIRSALGLTHTPLDVGIDATLRWAESAHSIARTPLAQLATK